MTIEFEDLDQDELAMLLSEVLELGIEVTGKALVTQLGTAGFQVRLLSHRVIELRRKVVDDFGEEHRN